MKYQWFEEDITIEKIEALTGKKVKGLTRGGIETGEFEDVPDETTGELVTMPIKRKGIEVEFEQEPAPQKLREVDRMFSNLSRELEIITIWDLPTSQHLARVKSIDVTKPKPVVITREYKEQTFDIPCVVTESVKDQFLAGDINVGDIVIVAYCEERTDDAIITSKVFKSW